jgi:DNA-binding transcriptional MerR regulator
MSRTHSIGQFAKSVRLSIKALRRYDAEGLLRPAVVDPETGYRYYTTEQSRDAVTIGMLRRLEVPLAVIRQLLRDGPGPGRTELLRIQRDRLAAELARKQEALAAVDRLLASDRLLPHAVKRIERPSRRLATLSFETVAERMEVDTDAAVRRLMEHVSQPGLTWEEPLGCMMFEADDDGHRSLVAFVGLPTGTPNASEVRVQVRPGGPAIQTRHVGSYLELGLAHFALHAHAREHGHDLVGPVEELYVDDPREVAAADLVTELQLPIRG